jgi:hypothetical protein
MADKSVVQLEIQSLLDGSGFDEAKEQLKKLGVNLEKTGNDGEVSLSKIDKEVKKTGNSFVELGAKIAVAYAAVTKFIKASLDQAKADAQLRQAIKNNTDARSREGKTVGDLTKEYKDFATAQQAATGIGDEITQQLQTLIVSFGTAPRLVNRVTAALQDMAAATGQDASMMARAWGRLQEAPEEALGALSRVGIKIRKEQLDGMDVEKQRIFVLEQLEQKFRGQAKVMAEASGGVAQAEAAFGDFLETIGNVIIDGLGPFIKAFSSILGFFNSLNPAMSSMIVAVGGLTTAFLAFSGVVSLSPVGWILTAGAALSGLVSMITNAEKKTYDLEKANEQAGKAISEAVASSDVINKTDRLISQLSMLKQGTKEYEAVMQDIISTNPELAKSGTSVKDSYEQIKIAVDNLKIAQRQHRAEQLRNAIQTARYAAQVVGGSTGGGFTLQGTPDETSLNYYSLLRESGLSAADALTKLNEALAEGRRLTLRTQAGYSAQAQQNITDMQITPVSLGGEAINSTAIEGMYIARRTPVVLPSDGSSPGSSGGSAEVKAAIDLWQLRIDLMTDEFEKKKEILAKQYNEEANKIRDNLGEGATAQQALADLSAKYIKERGDLEREEERRLSEERVRAYNEALSMMQQGLSLGTSIIKKDWRSAIGETLSMIPGVGQTLSGVFGTAVDFFGELFGSRSKTEAEKLGDWLEAAVQKFDKSFTRSETYSKLFGDLDLETINAEIASTTDSLNKNLEKLGLGVATSRTEFKDFYDLIKNDDFNFGGFLGHLKTITNQYGLATYNPGASGETGDPIDPRSEEEIAAFNAEQIRKREEATRQYVLEYFKQVYGDNAETMMRYLGVIDEAGNLKSNKIIKDIMGRFRDNRQALLDIAEQTATWYKQLEDSQIKKGLAKTNDELDRINKKFEIGEITKEEMVKRSSEEIDNAIRYLETLEPTQEVLDAITDLTLQRIRLQKELNEESAVGLDIEDEKLRKLLQQREELERNIAAGYVREGTSDTVSQQAAILRQIIARAKEIGLSRDDYFQYEEALANLMSGFAGSSYTGKTGFGYTPGVEDFVGNMPIGSSAFQTSMNTARASRSSTSNITTNTQNVTINGQAMVPNQEFVDGLRVLTKRVYGKDIIK